MPALTLPAATLSEPAQNNFYPRPAAPRGQRHYGHDLYDNNNNIPARSGVYQDTSHSLLSQHQPYAHSQTLMFSYVASPPSWYQPVQMISQNPYAPPPPPQIAHKVWILDCKSCGTFLTNRGMKAVLLLRPNVSLFSTDALPINCSAYTSNPDARRSSSPSPSQTIPRTCECLTQTLCCHGCGSNVGYMIVIPCPRCTSSITATNRATNGHRFVFHSSEITSSERHYVPGEPGVTPFDSPLSSQIHPTVSTHSTLFYPVSHLPMAHRQSQIPPSQLFIPPPPSSPPPLVSAYLPSPPIEVSELSPSTFSSTSPSSLSPATDAFPFPRPSSRSPPLTHPLPSNIIPSSHAPAPALSRGMPAELKEPSPARRLHSGEMIYWHHLAKNGEIPGVLDDPRARRKSECAKSPVLASLVFDR